MSELGGLLEGGIIGLAVSEAASTVVEPALEPTRQEAEAKVRARIHELPQLAQAVAQALLSVEDVADHVARNGYQEDEFAVSVQLALRAPGIGEALTLYRRRKLDGIGDAQAQARLYHAFAKAQIEYQYWPQLLQSANLPADLPTLGNAIQRGLMPAPFPLPYDSTPGAGKIPAFPVSPLDPVAEAEAAGYSVDHLFLATAEAGNPPGPQALYRAMWRDAIDPADVTRGLVEGRSRAEWAPAFEADAREILSSTNYVEARVRNWIQDDAMYAGTAKHGLSEEDTSLLFLIHGRPLSWHQVWIGLQRGGVYDGPTDQIDPAFLKALQESDIRPEWYNLAWAQRYSYPSAFVLRALAQAGDIDYDRTLQILTFEGWEPTLAQQVAASWTGGTGAKSKALTPTQVKAAYKAGQLPLAQALARLVKDNYTQADAELLLGAPAQTSTPPPIPSQVEIENLIAQGWTVTLPPVPESDVAKALEANGYTVTPPAPQPFQATVAPPQGG